MPSARLLATLTVAVVTQLPVAIFISEIQSPPRVFAFEIQAPPARLLVFVFEFRNPFHFYADLPLPSVF